MGVLEANGVTPLLTIEDVCECLHMTPDAIRATRSRNQEPGILGFKIGKRVMFKASDIQKWIDDRQDSQRVR